MNLGGGLLLALYFTCSCPGSESSSMPLNAWQTLQRKCSSTDHVKKHMDALFLSPLLSKATSSQVPPTQTQSAGWLLATPLLFGHSVLASLSDASCFPLLLFCLALASWAWHTVLAVEKSPVILEHVNIFQTWRTSCLKTMLRNYIGQGTFPFTLTCSLW